MLEVESISLPFPVDLAAPLFCVKEHDLKYVGSWNSNNTASASIVGFPVVVKKWEDHERFEEEVRFLYRLSNPNIVKPYVFFEVADPSDAYFKFGLVMEDGGKSLKKVMREALWERRISPGTTLQT